MRDVIILLVMFAAILGSAIVVASIGFSSIKALGRSPSAAPKIITAMIIALAFGEAVVIIALLILFQLFGK